MIPLIALALQFAPYLIPEAVRALGGDKAAEAAKTVIEVAQQVTGTDAPDKALDALKASPDAVLAYKKAQLDNKLEFERLDVKREEIAVDDRKSARDRQVQLKDATPAWLAFFVTAGFFGVLAYLLVAGKPAVGGDALLVMLGSLGTAWTAIISYYYGSSSSSKAKDETISRAVK
jgi:hypothetical protein